MLLKIVSLAFLLLKSGSGLQNPYCALSCNFGQQKLLHTVCERDNVKCGPAANCGTDFKIIKFSDKNRQFFLDMHNELRNKVASGGENRNNQPPAANMNVLTYDNELEYIAQCWANTCNGVPLIHDLCRSTSKYKHVGQNLAFFNTTTLKINMKEMIEYLLRLWYDEVAIFKREWVKETKDRGMDFMVGHYTQMMWAETKTLGCAMSYYTNRGTNGRLFHNFLLVCNYGPGGNYLGRPVYKIGKSCSSCSDGQFCNNRYKALCGDDFKVSNSSDFDPVFNYY